MDVATPFRALVHQPSARERAGAERAATALLAAVERAASDTERCAALKALQEACSAPRGEHTATALVRLDAVPRLCALVADDGEADAPLSKHLAAAEALYALGQLIDAASDHECACCNDGPTRAGTDAVEQLARCGGLSRLAALLQSHSHRMAFVAARCTQTIFRAVFYMPALEAVMTRECLENVLYLAGGDPRPLVSDETHVPDPAQLALLHGMVTASEEAAQRLARLPATLPLLLRWLEPDVAVKRLEFMETFRAPQDVGVCVRASQNDAARVLMRVFGAMQKAGVALPAMYVQPLLLSLLHIVLTRVTDYAALKCINFMCDTTKPALQLAKLVPVAMLRALCAQADSADGACARATVIAFAACSAANAALLKALLSPTSQRLLGGNSERSPAALSAAQVEQLKKTQTEIARRAFRARDDAASDHAAAMKVVASAELRSAASAATTARARLALQRAALYVRLCAMAPHVAMEEMLAGRMSTLRNGYGVLITAGPDAQEMASGWPNVTWVFSSSGLDRLTLREAPELHLLLDVPGMAPPNEGPNGGIIIDLFQQAVSMALFRVARRHGWDMMDDSVDDGQMVPPLLPVFDASGAFELSREELAINDELPPLLMNFTWRFERQPALPPPPAVPPRPGVGGSCLDTEDYVCSLAATLAAAPPRIAAQLRELLAVRFDAEQTHEAHEDCSHCASCMARRAIGRLCALPSCTKTEFVDGGALKLCKRCSRAAYCCREVCPCAATQQARACVLF